MPEPYPANENERIPESYSATFSYLPSAAFANNLSRRTIKVPWEDRLTTIQAILGWAELDEELDPPGIQRYLPWNDYDDPTMIAFRCDVTGKSYRGGNLNTEQPPMQSGNDYEFASIDVTFGTPRFRLGERTVATSQNGQVPTQTPSGCEQVRFCTKEVKPGIELVTAKLPSFKFSDGAQEQILFPVPITFSYEDTVVNWYAVPLDAVPITAIADCIGKVNEAQFRLPDIPAPEFYDPETVKLQTYQFTDIWLPNGPDGLPQRGVNITYFFKYRKKDAQDKGGWNYYPSADGTLRPVVRIADANKKPYLTEDFSKLFKPEP